MEGAFSRSDDLGLMGREHLKRVLPDNWRERRQGIKYS